jgi:hypothetical protein
VGRPEGLHYFKISTLIVVFKIFTLIVVFKISTLIVVARSG